MNEGRYRELLGRLLDDELDSTQARELADWLPRNPDRRSDVQHHLQLWDLFSQQCQRERTADAFVEACKTRIVAEAGENIFVRETEQKLRDAAGKTARTEGKPALSFRDWLARFIPAPRWVVGFAAVLLVGLSSSPNHGSQFRLVRHRGFNSALPQVKTFAFFPAQNL